MPDSEKRVVLVIHGDPFAGPQRTLERYGSMAVIDGVVIAFKHFCIINYHYFRTGYDQLLAEKVRAHSFISEKDVTPELSSQTAG